MSSSARARTAALLSSVALALTGTTAVADAATAPSHVSSPGLYVVALTDPPRPDRADRQRALQDEVLDRVGNPEVVYRFGSALNGFAADLTRAQVKQLRADPDVALVERSTTHKVDTVTSPDVLGADQAWAGVGGAEDAGRGKVVGVVDSGIWPESPGFAATPGAGVGGPRGFAGACEAGQQWDEDDCNNKVVSARYFVAGFGEQNLAASEFLSPRDGTGHGTHVAGIAAGNPEVDVRVDGQHLGRSSGMAPGARIAVYKACWAAPDPADDGCTTADAVAAIDSAVSDGVDVISYAVSGPSGGTTDAVELAFLNATAAGVFVAAPAGNRGSGSGSVAHTSPWVTTVGANSHHDFSGGVVLGGETHVGAMVSDQAVRESRIVLAEDVATHGTDRREARLCRPGSLDAALVDGAIVVCDRGAVPRVDKSLAVQQAGGVGMVLANVRRDSTHADFHAVPTVHLDAAAARAVKRYVAETAVPKAALDPAVGDSSEDPRVAPFSSRGPAPVDGGSLVKPDVTAPGVGVVSAAAPPSNGGQRWAQRSGTSMGVAHVAGLAALVMAERPWWTPAMVRSSMVTTADGLAGPGGPLSEGAGQVDAAAMLDPGVVLAESASRYRGWLAGRVRTSQLNLPSVAVGDLAGQARVVRRVTNVSGRRETYSTRVIGMDGVDASVRPASLTLAPGETGRVVVRLDRGTAPVGRPTAGYVVLTGSTHRARLPLVVTPRAVSVPEEASGNGSTGSLAFQGVAGADGRLDLRLRGLVGAAPVGMTLEPGAFEPARPAVDADTARVPVTVRRGASVLRVALEGRDTDDMDLHLYRDGRLVESASGSGADEVITLVDPAPGDYDLYVTSTVAGNGTTTTAQAYVWVVGARDAGNMSVPDSVAVEAGEPFGVRLSWSELDPTLRWFGVLGYEGSDEQTFVTVN